ncbi:GTPase HflX [Blastochloris sulfoviridis]|uniref:GTPase HflX n=1 Tax=Blastochloris sulfoviridis TaxID=50712 RepID=A0A5M6I7B0_9HYPH|nr:GTPase HflX [Blastochloris sulfoviridis]KAA5603698.1 GTPase HflX [Blastochloris sulfoviridis]
MLVPHRTRDRSPVGASARTPEARLDEAVGLAAAIDLNVVVATLVPLAEIRPATFLGKGKVEELAAIVEAEGVDLAYVDAALSPVQQRNLERAWKTKVIDRTALILEIFGRRARTREGTLQVELAHLNYQKSRLVRSWTHLERQRGGFGFLGGPGETQIETDRRLIGERITAIERELEQVTRTRSLHRKSRERVPFPVVALVGYTNAGKSTLFNRLTRAEVFAENLLFATLDPTLRALALPHGTRIILSDTVGFISELPTTLVAAFRATLEEVIEADLILHVRDVAHLDTAAQAADVAKVLGELGIDADDHARILEVWNKVDLLDEGARAQTEAEVERRPDDQRPALVSALSGDGVDALLDQVEARITAGRITRTLALAPEDGEGLAWLYRHADVIARTGDENTGRILVTVRVPSERLEEIDRRYRVEGFHHK